MALSNSRVGDFADDFVEGALGDALQAAAEKNFARADGLGRGGRAVDQIGHGAGQGLVGGAGFGPGLVLRGQALDLLPAQER